MTKTYTLTQEELDQLIAERLAHKPITPQGLFKDVQFEGEELQDVNAKYPLVSERLSNNWRGYGNPLRFVYTNKPKHHDTLDRTDWHTISSNQVHNAVRTLVVHVFGKSNNRDLTEDEYEMAQSLYAELKDWYIKAYDKRLETLEV